MYFTLETLLNHVFEDLRKPKAPNSFKTTKILQFQTGPKGGKHMLGSDGSLLLWRRYTRRRYSLRMIRMNVEAIAEE
jgi:hypothetical protein